MMKKIAPVFFIVLLVSAQAPAGRIVPNDPYFKYQVELPQSRREDRHRTDLDQAVAGRRSTPSRGSTRTSPGPGRSRRGAARRSSPSSTTASSTVTRTWPATSGRIRASPGPDASGHAKETNRVDDDGNGYVDDVMGWDFAFDDPDPDCYVFDGMSKDRIQPYWHSISALGIIGAQREQRHRRRRDQLGRVDDAAQDRGPGHRPEREGHAPAGAGGQGHPLRGGQRRPGHQLERLRQRSDPGRAGRARSRPSNTPGKKNVLLVVGAGNSGLDIDRPENFTYPACFALDNILTVAMIDFRGELVRYQAGERRLGSNFGPRQRRHRRPRREFHDRRRERPEHLPAERRDVQQRPGRRRDRRPDALGQAGAERRGPEEAPDGYGDAGRRPRGQGRHAAGWSTRTRALLAARRPPTH